MKGAYKNKDTEKVDEILRTNNENKKPIIGVPNELTIINKGYDTIVDGINNINGIWDIKNIYDNAKDFSNSQTFQDNTNYLIDKIINEPGKVEFSNILEDIRHLKNAEKLDNPATSIEEQIRLRIQYGQNKDEIQKAISNNIEYKELTKDSNEVFDKIFEEQTAIVEKADKLNQAAEIGQTIFDVATGVGIAKIGVGTAKTVGKEAIEETAKAGVKSGVDDAGRVTATGVGKATVNPTNQVILKDGYYEVNGLKFSEYYYKHLFETGRKAPLANCQRSIRWWSKHCNSRCHKIRIL